MCDCLATVQIVIFQHQVLMEKRLWNKLMQVSKLKDSGHKTREKAEK